MGQGPVPFGVFTVDTALSVRTWSAWLAQVTGIAATDALGRALDDVVPDARQRGLVAALERVLAGSTVEVLAPALHRYVIPCPPSAPSAVFDRMQQRVTVGPLREDDRVTGAIITIEDVTARLEREREIARRVPLARGEAHAGTVPASQDGGAGAAVTPLARALGDPDLAVRRSAVAGLAAHGPAVVGALVATLREQHGNLNALSSALALLEVSDVDVVEPLLAFLRDSDVDLRIQAALVLGGRHDLRAVPALMRALGDPDVNVQFHAIEALGRLRAAEAADDLATMAEGRDFFLGFPALQALAAIGDPRVAPRIVPLLGDDVLRAPAVEALGMLGDDAVVPGLVALLNQADAPTETIADALTLLYDRLEEQYGAGGQVADLVRASVGATGTQNLLDAVERVSGERLRGLARVLAWLEGTAVQRALARLLGNPSVRAQVVEALVRYGRGVVDLLIDQLRAEDLDTRHAAAVALGRIGDARAAGPLIEALEDPELALPAAGALARIGAPEAFEPLLRLVGDDDVAIRQAAIAALNSIGHPAMPGRIRAMLEHDRPIVRESAVRIAGYFGYAECVERVLALGSDSAVDVRRAVAEHLPYFDEPRATAALIALLSSDPAAKVRAAAAGALARLNPSVARPAALRALADPDPWVRYFALRAIGTWRDAAGAAAALDRLEHDPAGHVRLAAIEVLGTLHPPEAGPVLLRLADEADPDVAGAAIRALGRYRDPEITGTLERLTRARESWRRLGAIAALAGRADADAAGTLRWTAAADEDEDVVAAAVQALAHLSRGPAGTTAIQALIDLLGEPDRSGHVVVALSAIEPRHLEAVAEGLHHASVIVRRHTVEALGRMRHPQASRALERALRDADASVRRAAITALRRLGSTGAARQLLSLARTDPDPDVRRAALGAMTRTADVAQPPEA